ncbi:MAG TPA: ATP-binding protein [Nannocystaceae bacterium]|nr:ATP-binding protein [Nannocystaceae bacterium]
MSDEDALRRRIAELEAEVRALRAFEHAPYRAIVEDMSELIVRWLPDGTRLFVNDAYCRLFRADRSELVGTSFWPLVDSADRERVQKRLAALTPDDAVTIGRHRALAPDGGKLWMEWVDRAVFDEHGTIVEMQSVGRDITERVQLEEHARRVENADAVARVSAAIAHDLNNLLTVVVGELSMLPRTSELETVRVAVADIGELVKRLGSLRFGNVLRPRPVDLNARVQRLRGLLTEVTGDSVLLTCELAIEPCVIRGDATQIDQVLLNLVKNAAEAMPTGGEVKVMTRLDTQRTRAILEVADTGAGISAEVMPRLFDANVSTKPHGQGLGLATVKTIVEGHGGEVHVHSSAGGARFELEFPAAPAG